VLFTHDHHAPMGFVELNENGKPVLRAILRGEGE